MAGRFIDWTAIRNEYRGGCRSNRMIAAFYQVSEGAIRRRAKVERWERDLAEKVRAALRRKLEAEGHWILPLG